ncbi:MAG: hypothetical protein KA201_03495 [Kofleriaceae bacterium]|nr:hypothetical protein [Kofleriaceae bacterium]
MHHPLSDHATRPDNDSPPDDDETVAILAGVFAAYATLGVTSTATRDEVAARHSELTAAWSPPPPEAVAQAHRAFSILVADVCAEQRRQIEDALEVIRRWHGWDD